MTEEELIASTDAPATVDSLCRDLERLGVENGSTLLVHSSLSALGWVAGGPAAVVLALERCLGEDGTLVMPTHSSDLSGPSGWRNPPVPDSWWETIRQHTPAYEPDLTPTRGMGAIPECFRKQSGVVRSGHPQYSFAARGPHADAVTRNHSLAFPLGEGSPLARIYDLDGYVLLLGVDHGSNTSLHLAEYRARFRGKRTLTLGAPVLVDGARTWLTFEDIDLNESDFARLGDEFEEATGAVVVGRVALATARLMRQRPLVDFAVSWMERFRRLR